MAFQPTVDMADAHAEVKAHAGAYVRARAESEREAQHEIAASKEAVVMKATR